MAKRKYCYVDFSEHEVPLIQNQSASAAPTAADNQVDFFHVAGAYFEYIQQAQNDDVIFSKNALGWVIPNDNLANDGVEFTQGIQSGMTHMSFTIGTDPAFFVRLKVNVPDVSDYDVAFVGFRKLAAYTAALQAPAELGTDYTDIACLNINAGDLATVTRLNSGSATTTDTTDNVTDGLTVDLKVLVSAAGVVTFQHDIAAAGTLASPTINTNTLTFDSTDVVLPTFGFTKGSNAADTPPILVEYECGWQ